MENGNFYGHDFLTLFDHFIYLKKLYLLLKICNNLMTHISHIDRKSFANKTWVTNDIILMWHKIVKVKLNLIDKLTNYWQILNSHRSTRSEVTIWMDYNLQATTWFFEKIQINLWADHKWCFMQKKIRVLVSQRLILLSNSWC